MERASQHKPRKVGARSIEFANDLPSKQEIRDPSPMVAKYMSPKWLLIFVLCLGLFKVAFDIVIETTKVIKKSEAWCGIMF